MGKVFNVTADCKPDIHYMVNIDKRLADVKAMVDRGDYFTINRARQYGKTTMLRACSRLLKKDYIVVSLDFQMMSASKYKNENTFSLAFAQLFMKSLEQDNDLEPEAVRKVLHSFRQALREKKEEIELFELFGYLSEICRCSGRPVVLLIDEVDSAADNQVFLDFLAQLRGYYIDRDRTPAFQSVVLASVYDVKNLKRKIRPEEEQKLNSPWNIAADFLIDMSFSTGDIAGMLEEYESDYGTGMNLTVIADMIYDYTSGYPFLVSRICKLIDERIAGSANFPDRVCAWTKAGVLEAVRLLLSEQNTLFESLIHKLKDPELEELLRELLMKGREISYVVGVRSIETALMFGYVKRSENNVVVANRIFETVLYDFFLASPSLRKERIYEAALQDKNLIITWRKGIC